MPDSLASVRAGRDPDAIPYEPKPSPRAGRKEPDAFDYEAQGLTAIEARLQLAPEPIRKHHATLAATAGRLASESNAAYERVRGASVERGDAQRALERLERLAGYEGQPGRRGKQPALPADLAMQIEAAKTLLERADAAHAAAKEAASAAVERSKAARSVLSNVEARILDNASPLQLVDLPTVKNADLATLEAVRAEIADTRQEIADTRRRSRTAEEAIEVALAEVDRRAEQVRYNAEPIFRGGLGHFQQFRNVEGWAERFLDPVSLACFLDPDAVKESITTAVEDAALAVEDSIDNAERQRLLDEATAKLDELERREEALVRALEARGAPVLRRGDAAVVAVLSIAA